MELAYRAIPLLGIGDEDGNPAHPGHGGDHVDEEGRCRQRHHVLGPLLHSQGVVDRPEGGTDIEREDQLYAGRRGQPAPVPAPQGVHDLLGLGEPRNEKVDAEQEQEGDQEVAHLRGLG